MATVSLAVSTDSIPGSGDVELMGWVAAGDEVAFESLFRRHAPRVRSLLERLLGRGGEAEEVLQEVFLQVWQQAHRYQAGRATPGAWLTLIARSRAFDRLRSRQARCRRETLIVAEAGENSRESPPEANHRLELQHLRRELQHALQQLPTKQRQCVEMAFFHQLTQRQIAERLSTPLSTIKSRVQFGVRKLRYKLSLPLGPRPLVN